MTSKEKLNSISFEMKYNLNKSEFDVLDIYTLGYILIYRIM